MNQHVIVWQFRVRPDRVAEFERAYGPGGAWAQLFARSPAYLGTELLRDGAEAGRYQTVDHWESATAFAAFEAAHAAAYDALDAACAPLCIEEQCVGRFEVLGPEEKDHRPDEELDEADRQLFHQLDPAEDVDESDWLDELLEDVAGCIEADSPMGPLGLRYREEEGFWEILIYPMPVELVGGAHDGAVVVPGFSLDLEQLRSAFAAVAASGWNGLGLNDPEGPYVYVEGIYQEHEVYLEVLAQAPKDEEPGLKVDATRRPRPPN